MNTIRIHISDTERTCAVDGDELTAWGKALIDDILFAAAQTASASNDPTELRTTVPFRITLDREDGSVLIGA
jgi:hypothetical protein